MKTGDASFAEAILTATSYSDLVNKSEYVEKVHGYDRNKLIGICADKMKKLRIENRT